VSAFTDRSSAAKSSTSAADAPGGKHQAFSNKKSLNTMLVLESLLRSQRTQSSLYFGFAPCKSCVVLLFVECCAAMSSVEPLQSRQPAQQHNHAQMAHYQVGKVGRSVSACWNTVWLWQVIGAQLSANKEVFGAELPDLACR
jgi:hypothetical protein